ncbi:NADH dehydrogenase [ubiquinone] 1 alpha subcomplex subunit 3 [Colletes latitarsis]|uniref:NADH dehydrogenase [ubiquinone] 1 alpha subcomplex subunit 3 n=1 Tax=Colletes latitarsis TaxID=2605962 RepID=UPI004035BE1C
MVRILSQSIFAADYRKLYGQPLGKKIKYFWKKSWDEIPEYLAATPIMAATVVLGGIIMNLICTDKRPMKYYNEITIFRPDDPRVARIRKDETLRGERTF